MITNRIITRGMGTSRGAVGRAGMVTQGYGGIPTFVAEVLTNVPRRVHGRSGYRYDQDELNTVIIWAKLVEVNSRSPENKIQGSVTVKIDESSGIAVLAERLLTKVYKTWNDIKITVKRLK